MNSVNGSMTESRKLLGATARLGSVANMVMSMPGIIKRATIQNTEDHGKWSDKISANEPGTKPDMR